MGIFDFLFKKKKTTPNYTEIVEQKNDKRACVITNKVELTKENINDISHSFIAFDTETTGLSCLNDVIIEVGAVKYVDGKVVGSYQSLIDEGVPVPDAAFQVNHISTDMLRKQGKKPEVVYRELVNFFDDALNGCSYICAYNASFDMSFLRNTLERFGYNGSIQYIDALSLSKRILKGLPNYKQDTVANHFNIVNKDTHRAVTDAETCGEIFNNLLALKNQEIEKNRIKENKCIPTDEEKEVFAIIAYAMSKNGTNIQNLKAYRNTSNYVLMIDEYTTIKFKYSKKKSYVVVPKIYVDGWQNIEECTATEGTHNARLLFNDPFELDNYGKLFSKILVDKRETHQSIYENEFEARFLAQANVTSFTDSEINNLLENAKKRKQVNDELHRQAIQKEKEQAELKQAKEIERIRRKQELEEKKQNKAANTDEQRDLIRKMVENAEGFSEEDITQVALISAQNGKRAVLQLDDNNNVLKVYESISEASKSVGIAPKTIRDVANGKYKHGGGFCWKYADELFLQRT